MRRFCSFSRLEETAVYEVFAWTFFAGMLLLTAAGLLTIFRSRSSVGAYPERKYAYVLCIWSGAGYVIGALTNPALTGSSRIVCGLVGAVLFGLGSWASWGSVWDFIRARRRQK